MITLSPEQLSALKSVTTSIPNQVSAILNVSTDCLSEFINGVTKFVLSANTLHRSSYLILLELNPHPSAKQGDLLSEQTIQKNLAVDNQVFFIDTKLNLLQISPGPVKISNSEKLTEENETFGILIQGTYFYYLLCGKCIDEGSFISDGDSSPWPSNLYHPIAEFEMLLEEHKKNCVDDEKGFTYWNDKQKRILRASPENTESIFHRNLLNWLRIFVTDYLKIYAEPEGFGQCKTDITVVTHGGCSVIELKWLGKNENNTDYGQDRIEEGIIQIKIYLDKEEYVCGYLVLYDGRPIDNHKNDSGYNENLLHPKCKHPFILFLESESPSQSARRLQREAA